MFLCQFCVVKFFVFIAGVAFEDRDTDMDVCVNAKVKIEIPDEDFEGKLNCFHSPYCYIMYMVLDCVLICNNL